MKNQQTLNRELEEFRDVVSVVLLMSALYAFSVVGILQQWRSERKKSFDGPHIVQEKVSGTPTANIIFGLLDEVLIRTDSGGSWTPIFDGNGNTLALTDSSGVVQTEYTDQPFGETTTSGSSNEIRRNTPGATTMALAFTTIAAATTHPHCIDLSVRIRLGFSVVSIFTGM